MARRMHQLDVAITNSGDIMLTQDAFGEMPPTILISADQAEAVSKWIMEAKQQIETKQADYFDAPNYTPESDEARPRK